MPRRADPPEQLPMPDPFRYGWRFVKRTMPDGTQTLDQIALTLEDVLAIPGDSAILASATSLGGAPSPQAPQAVDPSTTQQAPDPSAAASTVTPPGGTTNVYLTIVNTPAGTTATVPSIAPTRAAVPDVSAPSAFFRCRSGRILSCT